MSLYKDASLVMIPSAYKDGKLYSIRPTDGDGDFTFSRGSNLAATRVDVNGLIEKGRENRLLQSNNFTSWNGSSGATLTPNQAGYDGSNDAWLVTDIGYTYQTSSVTGVHTYSIYAKAGTGDGIRLRIDQSGSDTNGYFNLSTGSIYLFATGSYGIDANIESVGNGWYRCSVTWNATDLLNVRFYVTDGAQGGNAGDTIYIQDAQLEAGLVATDYIETGASTAQAGILEDMPRLDYSGGASCPALLLEPQRSNQIRQSEYFGGWGGNGTRTDNYAISPEGVKNAAMLESNSGVGNGVLFIAQVSSSTLYKGSVYVKSAGATTGKFRFFDGSTGQSTTTTFTPTSEWTRVEVQRTTGASTTQIRADIFDNDGDLLLYGAQMEAGSYPTSYIPTYGASVTRSRDFAEATFAENDIAPTGGTTLFIEFETSGEVDTTPNTGGFYLKNNAGTLGYWGMSFGYGDRIYSNYQNGSTIQWDGATAENTLCKVAFQLVNGGKSFLNGTTKATTSVDWSTRPLGQLELQYGTKVKQAVLFPTILTDAECIALTTL